MRVDEKNLREYTILNCCGVIITTNHKTDGLYLPADDRRALCGLVGAGQGGFRAGVLERLVGLVRQGRHRARRRLFAAASTSAGSTPRRRRRRPKHSGTIVDAGRAPEEAELADVLDSLDNPEAVTLNDVMVASRCGQRVRQMAGGSQEPSADPASAGRVWLRAGRQPEPEGRTVGRRRKADGDLRPTINREGGADASVRDYVDGR